MPPVMMTMVMPIAMMAITTIWLATLSRLSVLRKFGQFGADHDDRLALRGQAIDEQINLMFGSDIDASRRFIEDDHFTTPLQPLCENDLLLVAARKVFRQLFFIGDFDSQCVHITSEGLAHFLAPIASSFSVVRKKSVPSEIAGVARQMASILFVARTLNLSLVGSTNTLPCSPMK